MTGALPGAAAAFEPPSAQPAGRRLGTAFWTLSDQAVVSLGSFAANIALARHLPSAEYGAYGLLLGGIMMLQMILASLVFHPLSIRRSIAPPGARRRLAWASLAVGGLVCMPLSAILVLVLVSLGRVDLVPPGLAMFLAWQLQEMCRRNLLWDLRFRAASVGDGVAYLGLAACAIALGGGGHLGLPLYLWIAAIFFLLGAGIQVAQLKPSIGPVDLGRLLRDFWRSASWSLLSNAVSALRLQSVPWALAWFSGTAAVAPLQAAITLVNLSNPAMMALCNVIPQTAARAHAAGAGSAWQSVRSYILLGLPLIGLVLGSMVAAPELALRLVYGASSPYLALGDHVRVLALAAGLGFVTETLCAYFHGIDRARTAFATNAAGALACLCAIPLVWFYGVMGACLTIAVVQGVRQVVVQILLTRELAADS